MHRPAELPEIETSRLRLRALRAEDAGRVRELAGDARVAEMTSQIPHPYPEAAAEEWIALLADSPECCFAIIMRESDVLIGAIGLHPQPDGLIAELGFWIGVPFWNRGFCSEAASEILRFGFEELDLQRIHAGHHAGNDASGRVQEKIGMKREGVQRWGISRFGELKDLVMYGITRPDWEAFRRFP